MSLNGWKLGAVADFAEVNPREPALLSDAPFVPMDAVEPGSRWAVATQRRENRGGARFRGGDVLFARITPCLENGKVAQWPVDGARAGGSTEFIVLRAKPELDASFLYYWAMSRDVRDAAAALMVGSTGRQRLAPADLASMPMDVPPRSEQRRIVDLLGSVDAVRAAARREATAAREFARRLRAQLFGDAEFELVRLAEAVQVTMGRQRSPKHQSGEHLVPYLRAANVKDGYLELSDVLEMNFTPGEQERYGLRRGDVLVTEGCGSLSQIGANAVWEEEIEGTVCFQNTLLRLRGLRGKTIAPFVAQWARYAFESGMFAAVSSGTNIFHIGAKRAADILFPVVLLERQQEIVALLDQAEEAVGAGGARLDAVVRLHAALVADLLSGAHRIPDSYDRLLGENPDLIAPLEP